MRKLQGLVYILCALSLAWPAVALAQGTPEAAERAESDALWGGTYVEQLPSCEGEPLCLALLTQGQRGDEYYYGVIQNNAQNWVRVRDVAVSLFDSDGEFAAHGESYEIAPEIISPGGHALIGITVTGEYISDFTVEAQFDFEPSAVADAYGVPVRVDNATVRGTGVLGEWTNTSNYTFDRVYVELACFADDGSITYTSDDSSRTGPYGPGAADRFAVEIYGDHDCENFVVTAYGRP